jgi:glycosyltransferase involved in cell wall biosynthesis
MKIALVHDYLIDYGGAERVLKALHQMYPDSPIYVSVLNKKGLGKFWKEFENADIRVSWFGMLPFAHRLISPFRFLLPWIWGRFDYSEYDLVITSAAWAVTKGVRRSGDTKEICYIHTPPRWLYGYDESRTWNNRWYGPLIKAYAAVNAHFLRMYDFNQAQKVDHFLANSENVAKRVEKFYRRRVDAVIYPPVEVDRIIRLAAGGKDTNSKKPDKSYYLTGGRMTAAKNFDLIIKAFNKLNLPLKIYGGGPLREELENMAGDNVEFLGRVSDKGLVDLYKNAKAFIVAQKDEDFGITPIEAMAAGTPVIAYRGGGYTESVIEDKTGVFFDKLTVESIKDCVGRFDEPVSRYGGSIYRNIKQADLLDQAKNFSEKRFRMKISEFVDKTYREG